MNKLVTTVLLGTACVTGCTQMPLKPNTETVAVKLKEAGYATALIGKWGLGTETTTGAPNLQGFDHYYGYLYQVFAHNHTPEYLLENGGFVAIAK